MSKEEEISEVIQQKLTSHNKHYIDRISISEEEYIKWVGSKCLPAVVPDKITISIIKGK